LLANHYPLIAPAYLPLTPLDRAIPFLVWTVWPYLLFFLPISFCPFWCASAARSTACSALTLWR